MTTWDQHVKGLHTITRNGKSSWYVYYRLRDGKEEGRMSRIDQFMKVYSAKLSEALKERPDDYVWPESELPIVVERMRNAILRRSYSKDGYAFKKTCSELGIKHTYTAISQWIEGDE